MSVQNQQKTIKKISKFLENTQNFENFKPNWKVEFTDGTSAKLKLEQENAQVICGKLAEGKSYLFTLEDGVYNGKAWVKICDVLAQGGMPEQPKVPSSAISSVPHPQEPGPRVDTTMPLNGAAQGMIINNSVNLVCARIKAGVGKADPASIKTDIEYFNGYFENMVRTGKLQGEPF